LRCHDRVRRTKSVRKSSPTSKLQRRVILQISQLTFETYRGALDAVQRRFTNTAWRTRFPQRGSAKQITTRRREQPQSVKRTKTRCGSLGRTSRSTQKLIGVWSLALLWSNTTR